uniref:Uncharacterized protein n=1 Tax=Spermophilus dauricus TaxID=99837 RepID=A0A8C9P5Y4_SPEDA
VRHLGAVGEIWGLTVDMGGTCGIRILGAVGGSELCLTLGSALGGLETLRLTADVRILSTLEADCEQGRLVQAAVSLGSPASLEGHFFRIRITRLFRTLEMFSCVNSGTSNGGWGHFLHLWAKTLIFTWPLCFFSLQCMWKRTWTWAEAQLREQEEHWNLWR